MPSSPLADHPVFNEIDINKIANETLLVQRKSEKFDPSCFVQTLLEGVISGNTSLAQLSFSLGQMTGHPMAKQALHKRFSEASSDFLLELYTTLVSQHVIDQSVHLKQSIFDRILVQDTSFNRIHGGNSEFFTAHGNGKVDTAGFKVDLVYDLLTAELESSTHRDATEQDKSIGKDLVDRVRANDLVLRDMGYFVMAEFVRIEEVGAYWLSRLPAYTSVNVMEGDKVISLEKMLKKTKANNGGIDLEVTMSKRQHKCRLVAVRASKSATRKARKERAKRSNLSSAELRKTAGWIRDGWHILVTNIPKEKTSKNELMKIYRMRWDIEIQFRAWKQSLKLDKALDKDSSDHHIYALVLASMIHLAMVMMARASAQKQLKHGELSLEKLAKSFSQFVQKAKRFEECWNYVSDLRHVRKDTRKRVNPVAEGIVALG